MTSETDNKVEAAVERLRKCADKWKITDLYEGSNADRHDQLEADILTLLSSKEAADQRCDRLAAEVERLNALVYAPGEMRCAKCKFVLYRRTLNAHTGNISAGTSETEPCPNGCGSLWPITWKEACESTGETAERFHAEKASAEAKLSALVEAVKGASIREQSVGNPDPSRRQASVIVTWYGEGSLGCKNSLSDTLRGIPPLEPISDHTAEPGGLTPGDAGRTAGAAAGDKSAPASLDRTAPAEPKHGDTKWEGEIYWRFNANLNRDGSWVAVPKDEEPAEPAQEVAGLVEKVARIIDPEIFKSLEAQAGFPPESLERYQNKRMSEALDKARAIAALASSPSQGGEKL